MSKAKIVAAAVLAGLSLPGWAATVSFSDSVPVQTTTWAGTMTVDKFDPSLGTLLSVEVALSGEVEGNYRFESLDSAPTTVTGNLRAVISLSRPDAMLLVQTIPVVTRADSVPPYDGTSDFGGTSGKTYLGLSANETDTATLTDPADLALFTGPGLISLPVKAVGQSNATGSGNLLALFNTFAGAEVVVTYDYAPVPLPAAVWLFGTGIVGLVGFARRRTAA
jgi:hypothetical protein